MVSGIRSAESSKPLTTEAGAAAAKARAAEVKAHVAENKEWAKSQAEKWKKTRAARKADAARAEAERLKSPASYVVKRSVEDSDFASNGALVSRKVVRIAVKPGLSRSDLYALLTSVAWEDQDRSEPNAVMVFAYRRGDAMDGTYSAGRCVLAPNGQWDQAKNKSGRESMAASVELNPLYFKASTGPSGAGGVRLVSEFDPFVGLSSKYETWDAKYFVFRAPNGTPAVILDTRKEVVGEYELIRYRVKVKHRGRTYTGWVNGEEVKK